ncbi:MAG: thioredoxin [Planctomycetes bacterium]|nr:thioredoxin [Planctomycetota bacterium]
MSALVTEFTDANFAGEALKSSIPVLVDFWAPWCGPCRMVGPTVEKLAGLYQGKLKVGKVNVDENPETATQFSISAIPTLLLFKDGNVAEQVVGVQSLDQLKKLIDKNI